MKNFQYIQELLSKNNLEVRHLNWGWSLYRKSSDSNREYHITTCETIDQLYLVIKELYK